MHAEWHRLDGSEWTPEVVSGVDADLQAGDFENHFHEAVPYVQFGLLALERVDSGIPPDRVLLELTAEFLPSAAAEVTESRLEHVRRLRSEHGDDLDLDTVDEYLRFGLRVLERAEGSGR